MNSTADKIIAIVTEAGLLLKKHFETRHSYNSPSSAGLYRQKEQHELVLEEDLISDEILVNGLLKAFPDYKVYSEERVNWQQFQSDKNFKFLIDPLDGTHNFYYGMPQWGISVALIDGNNTPQAGYIYLPSINLFLANSGGANEKTTLIYKNEQAFAVPAQRDQLSQCMFSYDNQFYRLGPKAMKIYNKIAEVAFTTRISGSAAFDTAMVASGRYDARIWNKVQPYDIVAGIPILRGAGGFVSDFSGNQNIDLSKGEVIICSNKTLGQKLVNLIHDVEG